MESSVGMGVRQSTQANKKYVLNNKSKLLIYGTSMDRNDVLKRTFYLLCLCNKFINEISRRYCLKNISGHLILLNTCHDIYVTGFSCSVVYVKQQEIVYPKIRIPL